MTVCFSKKLINSSCDDEAETLLVRMKMEKFSMLIISRKLIESLILAPNVFA